MIDRRRLVVRKAKDGINYEAVIMDYCGVEYERRIATAYSPTLALDSLISDIECEIYLAKRDLDLVIGRSCI